MRIPSDVFSAGATVSVFEQEATNIPPASAKIDSFFIAVMFCKTAKTLYHQVVRKFQVCWVATVDLKLWQCRLNLYRSSKTIVTALFLSYDRRFTFHVSTR